MNVKTSAEKEWLRELTTGNPHKNVTATCEFFYANEEVLEQNLRNSLQMLGVVRTVYREDLAKLSED